MTMTPTHDDAVAQALAAAIKDGDRIGDLLDELSRGRLWLPLPDDGGPVTDGSAVQLPTVIYLGSEFVPAFTSAEFLARSSPHVVVPAAELARRLPPGLGIALNPDAPASVPIYPGGVIYLAATEWVVGDVRIRLGQPPAEPEGLLREVSAALHPIPAALRASRAWLSVPGAGEGLIISVTLDDPADQMAQQEVLSAIAFAAEVAGPKAAFPVDVTFPGEHEPDGLDRWIAGHVTPFHLGA
jgi:SseB protein N-terminal domain/SseB protein C-terminal domain